jgi:hypothetical protein
MEGRMQKLVLPVLFGLALCGVFAECLIYSTLDFSWEARNLDGSSSITWRTGIVLLLLIAAAHGISFWTFRHRIALRVFLWLALCAAIATCLLYSIYSFSWELQESDGTFLLTWRTDGVILLLLSITQGLSFLVFRLFRLRSVRRHNTVTESSI